MNRTMKYVSSKLVKTKVLLQNPALITNVPRTAGLTSDRLLNMLNRYKMVYIKPVCGSLGIGVIRVEQKGAQYRYREEMNTYTFRTFQQMYLSIQRRIGSKPYLVQKGIVMLKHNNRPFDFRVMVQRNDKGIWECTGVAARLAHPKRAVTNGSQGGTIYAAEEILSKVADITKAQNLVKKMKEIGLKTANQFGTSYPAMNELGLDIAVDRDLRLWILEVNTRPDPCPFTKLSDSSMIETIVKYAKEYGRVYELKCNKAKKSAPTSKL
ncbi:YheC/YheD family protein [Paenibacillus glacialis]|nr:YheC/YheD family protein [Paenibacillus glacialis]